MRHSTRDLHIEVESALPVMDEAMTEARYGHHLLGLRDAVLETEHALSSWRSSLSLIWGHQEALLPRGQLLHQDIEALVDDETVASFSKIILDPLPALPSLPHAVGCWYVLGGSRLGGQIIARQLRRLLVLSETRGLAYYGACCPRDSTLFREFCRTIDGRADLTQATPDVVQGARSVFLYWQHALLRAPS